MLLRTLRTIFIALTQAAALSATSLTALTPAGAASAAASPAPAAAAAAAAAAARPTIRVTASVATLGTPVKVYGESPALLQTVRLEVETAENGWQVVDHSSNLLGRGYAFTAPGWYGTHRLRVVASGALLAPASVSDIRTVKVTAPYDPKGSRSDWSWISHKGARWDPCSTITYRINPAGGYAQSTADIAAAFRKVSDVSGFRFVYAGTTKSTVRRTKHGRHPLGTDVIIDWQSATQDRGLTGKVAGIGGHWVQDRRRFDGYVVLDQGERLKRAMWRRVIAHELGHVFGLGHARAPVEVMHQGSSLTDVRWGKGDLAGLQRVGASRGCLGRQGLLRGTGDPEPVSQAG